MSDKLEKAAINMSQLIKNADTYQDVYNELIIMFKQNHDFFRRKKMSDLVKLVFYIGDYLKTGTFNNAKKIIYDLVLGGLILRTDEIHYEECKHCGGDGEYNCPECDFGEISCNDCSGTGRIEVEDEDGYYDYNCSTCGGDGKEECDYCVGKGYIKCYDCDGLGEIETNENYYQLKNVLSWSNTLNYEMEKNANKPYPVISENSLLEIEDYIVTFITTTHFETKWDLTYDDYYCIGTIDDLDELSFYLDGRILGFNEDDADFF